MHAFDRRTDGQTEFSLLDRVCIQCSAVKIKKNKITKCVKCNALQLEAVRRRTSRSRLYIRAYNTLSCQIVAESDSPRLRYHLARFNYFDSIATLVIRPAARSLAVFTLLKSHYSWKKKNLGAIRHLGFSFGASLSEAPNDKYFPRFSGDLFCRHSLATI